MKLILNYSVLLVTVFLFSCNGLHHGNFNKRKYTNLKSGEIITEVEPKEKTSPNSEIKTVEDQTVVEAPTHPQDAFVEGNTEPGESAPPQSESNNRIEPTLHNLIESKEIKETFSLRPKLSPQIPQSEPVSESEKPFLIAWLVYLAAGIAAIALAISGLYLGLGILIVAAGVLALLVLIAGIVLLVMLMRQSRKENNSNLIKFLKIMTLLELILAGVAVVAVLVFLIILLFLLIILSF